LKSIGIKSIRIQASDKAPGARADYHVDRDFVGFEDLQYADMGESSRRPCTEDQSYLGGPRRRQERRWLGNTCKGSEDTGYDKYR
jgi:hypothetical protein